ncbi:MAG: hypothetical protein ACXQTR_05555 [Candidatus Methanospirareceae archaeon]
MFGKKKPEPVTFKGLMPKLFSEIFGGEVEAVIIDPKGLIIVSWGNVALKYSASGFELAIRKTGNEVYDAILRNKLAEVFKAVGEGEGVFTMKIEPEFGIYYTVNEVMAFANKEYQALLEKIKNPKKKEGKKVKPIYL